MADYSKVEEHPDNGCCRVSEAEFPRVGKCCKTREGVVGMDFNSTCPCCSILKLPIDSSSLEAVTFFECTSNGYVKRVKDSEPLG